MNTIIIILIFLNVVGYMYLIFLTLEVFYNLMNDLTNNYEEISQGEYGVKDTVKKVSKVKWRILEYTSYISIILSLVLIITNEYTGVDYGAEFKHLIGVFGVIMYIVSQHSLKVIREDENS